MNLIIALWRCLSMNRHSNPDMCDTGAVLHHLSYQANREQYRKIHGQFL